VAVCAGRKENQRPVAFPSHNGAWCTALFLVASWLVHWSTRKREQTALPAYRIPIELLGVVAIALTAHLGGFLSGVNM